MAETFDVLVIGGGLAGLGVALPQARDHGRKVVVLDAGNPEFNGEDRFNPHAAASFKNAGILDLGGPFAGIKEYFARRTVALYRDMGIPVKDSGAYVMSTKLSHTLMVDQAFKKISKSKFNRLEPGTELASTNKGVFRYPRGSLAEPEAAMKTIVSLARDHVDIRYNQNVEVLYYKRRDSLWHAKTSNGVAVQAKRLVIAAGPGSKELLEKIGLEYNVENIIGVMTQTGEQIEPGWFSGTLLGAKSLIDWTFREVFTRMFRAQESIESTSWFGESTSWTTHLYLTQHNRHIYVGGPRIQAPDDNIPLEDMLEPKQFQPQMDEAIDYARKLVKFPEGSEFNRSWTGVMAFPTDNENALVGPVEHMFDHTLFVSTGFASSGFREAFGAGEVLSNMMQHGFGWIKKTKDKDLQHFAVCLPTKRLKKIPREMDDEESVASRRSSRRSSRRTSRRLSQMSG